MIPAVIRWKRIFQEHGDLLISSAGITNLLRGADPAWRVSPAADQRHALGVTWASVQPAAPAAATLGLAVAEALVGAAAAAAWSWQQ